MARPRLMDHQKIVKLDGDLNSRLADYRFASRFKSEAEAIRELMRLGLASLQEKETLAV
jgi:Arc/MetJ-type ribon-helix-helix transcriptional regulator